MISAVAHCVRLNPCLRNDLKQSGMHQGRIALKRFLSPVTLLPGREVLEAMECHQITKRGMASTLRVDPV